MNGTPSKVTPDGIISTVAGGGSSEDIGDGGLATNATLYDPAGIAVDGSGNMFIADRIHNRIRKVTADGIITTVAGNGVFGFSGDGGRATDAAVLLPDGVAVDANGNIFFTANDRVRKISPAGIITTVAGGGTQGGDGGQATNTRLQLSKLSLDVRGNIFIADLASSDIRMVTPEGIINTVAGNGRVGFSGDGTLAIKASLAFARGVAIDALGNLFIADTNSNRIREVLTNTPTIRASPAQLQFGAASGGARPAVQRMSLTSSIPGISFSVQSDSSSSWLNLSVQAGASPRVIEVTADPTNLMPGEYSADITITSPLATPAISKVIVRFSVAAGELPRLATDKSNLSFPFSNAGKPRSQSVTVSDTGGGRLQFVASARTNIGGMWLSVSPGDGLALPSSPVSLVVKADPTGLPPGTYTGSVEVKAGGEIQIVPVTMTISQLSQAILLSQTGLSFLGVSNGGVVPSQTFSVLNTGSGLVNWTVQKSTLSGGNDWLQIDTTTGSTDSAAAIVPTVSVSVNPSILQAGKYYGLVQVNAPGAANSPQVITVYLEVLVAGSDTGALVTPAELSFIRLAGGQSPGSKDLMVYNISSIPKTFRASVASETGLSLVILPTEGTLVAGYPSRVVVQPIAGTTPGLYTATLTLQFSDGLIRTAKVTLVIPKNGSSGSFSTAASRVQSIQRSDQPACLPTRLITGLTSLSQSFNVAAGWPVALTADVKDDCGDPLETGIVSVAFSNGDSALQLQSVKGGRWEHTWVTARVPLSNVTLKLQANDPQRQLKGESQVSGGLQTSVDPPIFAKQGIVSAAGGPSFVALAPGSIISVYGDRLARTNMPASTLPLPTTLVETQVLMAGRLLPLFYVSQNQVNALVPLDITVNTAHQILIRQGNTYSNPVAVDVGPAQPAIFTDSAVASNQGIIIVVRGQGAAQVQFEAKPSTPARSGDTLVIYCAGLGSVSPAIASGAPAWTPVPNTTNSVSLTIGNQNAPILFSGLAPGFVGLYQLNAIVPNGVPSGSAVPVTMSVSGQTSPTVVMAIQ